MDIAGVRRRMELFAPEIDPRLFVRMKAAGLTLDDVLNSTSGNVPPYRFTYLIEKAKQHAGTLQSFGSQLLSAIEKRDAEELAQLRAVHEQNLLKMRARMVQLEIDAAEDAMEGLRRQKAAAEYRQGYFRSLERCRIACVREQAAAASTRSRQLPNGGGPCSSRRVRPDHYPGCRLAFCHEVWRAVSSAPPAARWPKG